MINKKWWSTFATWNSLYNVIILFCWISPKMTGFFCILGNWREIIFENTHENTQLNTSKWKKNVCARASQNMKLLEWPTTYMVSDRSKAEIFYSEIMLANTSSVFRMLLPLLSRFASHERNAVLRQWWRWRWRWKWGRHTAL